MVALMNHSPNSVLAKKILVVEDELSLVELLTIVFEEHGYHVDSVSNGKYVIDAIRRIEPDAITLDLGLPGLDGQAILTLLAADPKLRNIPVVVVSAFADELKRTPQVRAVVRKPFDLNHLIQEVSRVTSTHP